MLKEDDGRHTRNHIPHQMMSGRIDVDKAESDGEIGKSTIACGDFKYDSDLS